MAAEDRGCIRQTIPTCCIVRGFETGENGHGGTHFGAVTLEGTALAALCAGMAAGVWHPVLEACPVRRSLDLLHQPVRNTIVILTTSGL